jgi:hypothetical protein
MWWHRKKKKYLGECGIFGAYLNSRLKYLNLLQCILMLICFNSCYSVYTISFYNLFIQLLDCLSSSRSQKDLLFSPPGPVAAAGRPVKLCVRSFSFSRSRASCSILSDLSEDVVLYSRSTKHKGNTASRTMEHPKVQLS